MSEITTKISNTVKKYNMLSKGDKVVVGVSGGADSMLLLNYLISVKAIYSLEIIVANVEHGIRGIESVNDSAFVEKFCRENDVKFEQLNIDAVTEAKEKGIGVEEYSRNVRYKFFESFCADKIATAHNLTDNVETLLFRLSRGTSLKGCCGIPPVRDNIIRPLIECNSEEIRHYCIENGIDFVIDSTNKCNDYSRNYIRNEILPKFKNLNPSFESAVDRFINNAVDDECCLDEIAMRCFEKSYINNRLTISVLNDYSIAVVKRTIVKYISLFYDSNIDNLHLNGIVNLLCKSGKFQLSDNVFVISDSKTLRIAQFNKSQNFDNIKINKKVISYSEFLNNYELYEKNFDFCCDYDKITTGFSVRQRKTGDKIQAVGRNCTKTLKKLFNEYKIPIEKRESIPVIVDDCGILGVYGYCVAQRVEINEDTSNVFLMNVSFEDL